MLAQRMVRSLYGSVATWLGVVLFCAGICTSSVAALAQNNALTWQVFDFPPANFIEGELKGQGFNDRQMALLADNLPDYVHHFQVADVGAVVRRLAQQETVCSAALLKTPERAKFIAYSEPIVQVYSPGLVSRQDLSETIMEYTENGEVNLYNLVVQSNVRIGWPEGRRFGRHIDGVLTRLSDYFRDRIHIHAGRTDANRALMRLLALGRIDVMFAYAHEAEYLVRQSGVKVDIFFNPVAGADRYVPFYVACPNNDWGRRVVSRVNALVAQSEIRRKMNGFYADWLDEHTRESYLASF